jgi:hypothetical protein
MGMGIIASITTSADGFITCRDDARTVGWSKTTVT